MLCRQRLIRLCADIVRIKKEGARNEARIVSLKQNDYGADSADNHPNLCRIPCEAFE